MTNLQQTRLVLHLCAGGAVALAAVLADHILERRSGWGSNQIVMLIAGLVIMLMGLVRPGDTATRISSHICVFTLSLLLCLAVAEGLVRATGFELFREQEAWRGIPIFYRAPIEPTGEVFFKRPGPDRWSGQVLNTQAEHLGIVSGPYDESVITVAYDRRGFRNPDDMSDWSIAVAGDSYTEAGYLPQEQLFTSIMAERLNMRVLNLGVSDTGPLTHLHYLDTYGISASTRYAVIVFFEGNDLEDMALEYDALDRWRRTGQREYRRFRQASFLRPLYVLGRRALDEFSRRGQAGHAGAYVQSPEGRRRIDLMYAPPHSSDLSAETRRQLDGFLKKYAEFGDERQVEVALAYLPDARRVLHGRLEFPPGTSAELRDWEPTDLPNAVAALCMRYGVAFIDLTPALIRETQETGRLLYNPIFDLHLNADGSRVVGDELARHFSGPAEAGPYVRREDEAGPYARSEAGR